MYEKLGIEYPLKGVEPPSSEEIEAAEAVLKKEVINGSIHIPKRNELP